MPYGCSDYHIGASCSIGYETAKQLALWNECCWKCKEYIKIEACSGLSVGCVYIYIQADNCVGADEETKQLALLAGYLHLHKTPLCRPHSFQCHYQRRLRMAGWYTVT